jgi:hypothetical protein
LGILHLFIFEGGPAACCEYCRIPRWT